MHEDKFILNAARLTLTAEHISNLKRISGNDIDWAELERKACIHGVGTFIYYSLKNNNLSHLIPSEIFKRFQENFYRNAIRNSIFIEGIDSLSSIIDNKIILLKGAYLIQYLYPNIAIRSMCDIDILVEKEKVKKNWNKLVDHGFKLGDSLPKSTVHEKNACHLPSLYSGQFMTEVHWNLFGGERFYAVTQKAWSNFRHLKNNIYSLSDEMLLIHLCVHFYKHLKNAAGMRMLCDINELILKVDHTINWNEIDELCSDQDLRNEVSQALTYTHILLNTPIPSLFIDEKIGVKKEINLDSLTVGNQKSVFGRYLSILSRFKQPSDRIQYVFRTIFPIKSWMKATYEIKSSIELAVAYYKYWRYMFRRHILNKTSVMPINSKQIKTDMANIMQATRFVYQSDKRLFMLRLFVIVMQSILPLVSLFVLKLLVDTVTGTVADKVAISDIWLYACAFCGVFLFTRLFTIINQVSDEILTQKLIDFISNLLHKKSTELDLAYYDNAEYHDTFHRAQQEANYRPIQILDNLTGILQNSLSLAGIVVLLFTFSWLGIVIMIVAGLPSLCVKLVRSKALYNWRKKNTHLFRKANYFSMLMTNRSYAKEVRVFNLAGHFQKQFGSLRTQLVKQIKKIVTRRAKYDLISAVFEAAALLSIIYLLGTKAYTGAITLGSFVMFFEAFRRGQSFVQALVRNASLLYENKLFLTNLFEFLDLQPQIQPVAPSVPFPKQLKQGIRFENVSFKYPGSNKWALRNYHLTATPGEVTLIEGENGAGKTTLIKLLCRLYECTEGRITIEGTDIRQFDLEKLRKNISVLFQDFAQYDFTVQENILLGNIDAPADGPKIQQAAHLGCATPVIDQLPDAYNTLLGKYFEKGEELSMGQWQRVALARAIYKDTPVLVLDEPTSWVDVEATNRFKQYLSQLKKGRIVLLISHTMQKEIVKTDSFVESNHKQLVFT